MSAHAVRPEKRQLVQDLRQQFARAQASFVFNYRGCSCAELSMLRRALGESGSRLKVVKNTLARRASAETAAAGLQPFFVGQVAVVLAGTDPVSTAKTLTGFAKEKDQLEIKGGVVEGQVVSAKEIEALATLPNREQLIGQLVGLLNAPATRLLQTVNAPAASLVRVLQMWSEKLNETGKTG